MQVLVNFFEPGIGSDLELLEIFRIVKLFEDLEHRGRQVVPSWSSGREAVNAVRWLWHHHFQIIDQEGEKNRGAKGGIGLR